MGVTILPYTTKTPLEMMGYCAGVCWGANVSDAEKNIKRGLDCIESDHGRVLEFPEVYAVLEGYSARVIREWYTHIGGMPTRLQASTRYIDYTDFDYFEPVKIFTNAEAHEVYKNIMNQIADACVQLDNLGIPREDTANALPLGMTTKIIDKRDLRNIVDMSHQRECARAYHEFRRLFQDYLNALCDYSDQWAQIIEMTMKPKCEVIGHCPEKRSCGRMPKKEMINNQSIN